MPPVQMIDKPCYYSKPRFIKAKVKGTFPVEYRTMAKRRKENVELCPNEGIISRMVDGATRFVCLDHARATED